MLKCLVNGLFIAGLTLGASASFALVQVGDVIPCVNLVIRSGESESVGCYINPERDKQFTFIEFARTTCQYCTEVIPEVKDLARSISAKATVRYVMTDRSRDDVDSYMNEHGIDLPVAYDTSRKAYDLAGAEGTPTFVLVDRSGKVLFVNTGTMNQSDYSYVKSLVNGR